MASANLRILGAVAARAWGQKTPSGSPEPSPRFFQDALEGARTPKTPRTPCKLPSGSPLASPRASALGASTPRASPTARASPAALAARAAGTAGEAAAGRLPRLLGRPAAAAAAAPARASRVRFQDPGVLAAAAREALLASRGRAAERGGFLRAEGQLEP